MKKGREKAAQNRNRRASPTTKDGEGKAASVVTGLGNQNP
jgi:hypothetical protein